VRFDSPFTLVVCLAIIAVWWSRRPASRAPRRLLWAVLIVFYLAATPIGAGVLAGSLSYGLRPITDPAEARGAEAVVILAGGVQTVRASGVILTNLTAASTLRVLEGARVFKLIGARLAVVSGGIADRRTELRPEAEYMAEALQRAGVPADKIAVDLLAENTFDHARTVRTILEANHIQRFVVVTSPPHMRRALAVFRGAGFDAIPSVSLLRSDHLRAVPLFLPNDDSLLISNMAIYEYAGWMYYFARRWV